MSRGPRRSVLTSMLTEAERDVLTVLADRLVNIIPGEIDTIEWITAARALSCELPCTLRRIVRQFRRDPGEDGYLLLPDLPIRPDRLPPTPMVVGSVQRTASRPASILALVALQLGEIIAYREEKSGALVQDVVPVPGMEAWQGNAGSDELEFHVENAFHADRPDFVCLLCVRADHDRVAGLRVAPCRRAVRLLTARARRVLSEPRFRTTAPASFGGLDATVPHAVLHGCPEDPDLRVDFTSTEPADPEAGQSLVELRKALVAVQETINLDAGDLAILDNRLVVHGRTAFRPQYDGADRWLQRAFVQVDFRRSRGLRPADGHVICGW